MGLNGHLHTFRHTFISQALSRGVPEAVVRDWVGHVDPSILRLYTHISQATSTSYVEKFAGDCLPRTRLAGRHDVGHSQEHRDLPRTLSDGAADHVQHSFQHSKEKCDG